jgi:hypothetical protein
VYCCTNGEHLARADFLNVRNPKSEISIVEQQRLSLTLRFSSMSSCCCASLRPAVLPRITAVCKWAPSAPPQRGWRWCSGGSGGAASGNNSLAAGGGLAGSSGDQRPRSSTVAAAAVRDDLLRGVSTENRDAVARVVEQAQRAADSWTTLHTDFHTPPVVAEALTVLQVGLSPRSWKKGVWLKRLQAWQAPAPPAQALVGTTPRPSRCPRCACTLAAPPLPPPANPQRMADVSGVAWGGYPQAERCRLVVGREEAVGALAGGPAELGAELGGVAAVEVKGNFMFDPATHRDFLGGWVGGREGGNRTAGCPHVLTADTITPLPCTRAWPGASA